MTAEPNRRRVLCGLAMALVAPGAVAAACTSDDEPDPGAAGTGGPPPVTTKTTSEPEGAIIAVSRVPVGGGVITLALGNSVLLVQPKKGTIEAFDPVCPHQGFTVNTPQNDTIVCPGHGSRFDATTGARKSGPAPRGLTKIPIKITKGYVVPA